MTNDRIHPITGNRGKILLIATVDVHFQAFHLPVMRWFQEQGFEVHVAANGPLALPYCDKRFNLPFQRSPYAPGNLRVYRELKQIIDGQDYALIHCHTPVGALLGRLAARTARKRGTRVLYTAHGFHFCKGAPLLNWLLYYPGERFLARFTDCLITITEEDFSLATRHHFPARQIVQVPGVGVDTDLFVPLADPERQTRRESLGYGAKDILLFYAAEFNANKNQAMLIRALALAIRETPNLRLLLAGNGPLQESCRELAAQLRVEKQVDFLGFRQDLPALLPLCDIAVASSRREGLPVNVMEAMACGLPVVAAANRGHGELVADGKTGFVVPPNDHSAMAVKLVWLAGNPQGRKAMGEAGRERIRQRYAQPVAIGAMNRVYNQFLRVDQ
jgi:glycosyltransferase EpsD